MQWLQKAKITIIYTQTLFVYTCCVSVFVWVSVWA